MHQPTGSAFQKKIHGDYYSHVTWIQQQSMGTSDRCRWLWFVLDSFAAELRGVPDVQIEVWRSATLNPLLVRAFHGIPDDDSKQIERVVAAQMVGDALNLKVWQEFYMNLDVINSAYCHRWTAMRSTGPPTGDLPREDKDQSQKDPGWWNFQNPTVAN